MHVERRLLGFREHGEPQRVGSHSTLVHSGTQPRQVAQHGRHVGKQLVSLLAG
jgi:hypothetical protein